MKYTSLRPSHLVWVACLPILLASHLLSAQSAPVTRSPWLSEATGQLIPREEWVPQDIDPGEDLPTVIYFQNLASPRVGREADPSIINSFLEDGMLVITLDYAEHAKARLPFINMDFLRIREQILADEVAESTNDPAPRQFPTGQGMNSDRIFFVPEGCRLRQNVAYEGSRKMDIIYPSDPVLPVGALLQFSADNVNRMGNFSMAVTHDTILPGQACEGLAVAMADHPVVGGYGGIDYMPMSAWSVRAAVRALRAQRETLPLNGRIATMGFSRGSGVALMAVTTANVEEWTLYSPRGDRVIPDDEIPVKPVYPDEDPTVQGAVIMSGRFTYIDLLPTDDRAGPNGIYTLSWGPIEENFEQWRDNGALDFLQEDPGYPLFLTINKDDEHAHHQMDVLRERLIELGVKFIFREDTEELKAHRMPLIPEILNDMNRYLKNVLLEAGPYAAPALLQPRLELNGSDTVIWMTDSPVPPADYRLQTLDNDAEWISTGIIRPDQDGLLSHEFDTSGQEPLLVRLIPPSDPVP